MEIQVFENWSDVKPERIGFLYAERSGSSESFAFSYDDKYLETHQVVLIDPDLELYSGRQYPSQKVLFGSFSDSAPDRWGRLLLKQMEALQAKRENRRARTLTEADTNGARANQDLPELWRRIVFNMAVSNSDDHLRNHGFLLAKNGWRLSPAYDMNPDPYRNTLSLNVDENSNLMDISLAIDAAFYFGISKDDAHSIARDVLRTVSNNWERMHGCLEWYSEGGTGNDASGFLSGRFHTFIKYCHDKCMFLFSLVINFHFPYNHL